MEAARREIELRRSEILNGNGAAPSTASSPPARSPQLERGTQPTLRPVINATGVVVHTNLGRAPLAFEALEAIDSVASGYSNLEYDLEEGGRGSRQAHVEALVSRADRRRGGARGQQQRRGRAPRTGRTGAGREVVISRGQLIEIGGSFRIPEILAQSGARLVEVGTTNRTRLADYERAIGPDTAALMRVHPSNFRAVGFTEEVALADLCALGRAHGVAVIDDLGIGGPRRAGTMRSTRCRGTSQPRAKALRRAQTRSASLRQAARRPAGGARGRHPRRRSAGCARIRSHGRCGSTSSRWRRSTRRLRLHRDPERARRDVPVLQMLAATEEELAARAERLRAEIAAGAAARGAARDAATGRAGGGALPLLELEGPVVAVTPVPAGPTRCTRGFAVAIRRSSRACARTRCCSTRGRSPRSRSTSW